MPQPKEPPTPEAIELGIRRHRRIREAFDGPEMLIAFCERHYKVTPESGEEALLLLMEKGYNRKDLKLSGTIALCSLETRSLHGDVKASEILLHYFMGQPDKSFAERMSSMSREELIEQAKKDAEEAGVPPMLIEYFQSRAS